MRTGLLLHAALGALAGAIVALAPAPSFAGARGLRASHAPHGVSGGRVHVSHGVEVLRGCGADAAHPGHLGPRPVAHRPLRGVPDPGPRHFHDPPLVVFVDEGPEVVIDQPGLVIIIE